MHRHLPLLLASMLLCAACGEATQTKTVTERTIIKETSTSNADETTGDSSTAQPESTDQPASSATGGKIRVPNVRGKDLQLAQDTMQASGLYNLSEEDATGQGRLMLYDRNWTVVEQSPPAGSRVNEDTTVVLRAKKDDE
jgi:hypothetical protein